MADFCFRDTLKATLFCKVAKFLPIINQYQINPEKIVDWIDQRVPELENKERVDGLLEVFKSILSVEKPIKKPLILQGRWW